MPDITIDKNVAAILDDIMRRIDKLENCSEGPRRTNVNNYRDGSTWDEGEDTHVWDWPTPTGRLKITFNKSSKRISILQEDYGQTNSVILGKHTWLPLVGDILWFLGKG